MGPYEFRWCTSPFDDGNLRLRAQVPRSFRFSSAAITTVLSSSDAGFARRGGRKSLCLRGGGDAARPEGDAAPVPQLAPDPRGLCLGTDVAL